MVIPNTYKLPQYPLDVVVQHRISLLFSFLNVQLIHVCEFIPKQIVDGKNNTRIYSIEDFQKYKCLLVSGIGNPGSFEQTMRNVGINIELFNLNDHHIYPVQHLNYKERYPFHTQ